MSWKLTRWKPCDGGCCVRSPRFPRPDNLGTVPGRHPAFMADCIYHLNEAGGVNPDGSTWRGGCALYRDLLQAVAERNAETNINRLRLQDITNKPSLGPVVQDTAPRPNREMRGTPAHWFLDTCWKWPVPTALIQTVLNRLAQFGWYQPAESIAVALDTAKVYTDEEYEATAQGFHVTWEEVQDGSAALVEAACCWVWEPV